MYSNMNIIIICIWLFSIAMTQCIHGKVITINNSGSNSSLCCMDGICACNSLPNALSSIESNTVINITSQVVTLNIDVVMRYIYNVTIIGANGTMVMCNNTGSVHCERCIDITIEAITWDQCGNIDYPTQPGISLNIAYNIFIINCIFQKFNVCISVLIVQLVGPLYVINSKFMFNTISDASMCYGYSSLAVLSGDSNVFIYDSLFYHNGDTNQGIVTNSSLICIGTFPSVLVENTSFIYNGIGSISIRDQGFIRSNIILTK